jgi:hypothetical protein
MTMKDALSKPQETIRTKFLSVIPFLKAAIYLFFIFLILFQADFSDLSHTYPLILSLFFYALLIRGRCFFVRVNVFLEKTARAFLALYGAYLLYKVVVYSHFFTERISTESALLVFQTLTVFIKTLSFVTVSSLVISSLSMKEIKYLLIKAHIRNETGFMLMTIYRFFRLFSKEIFLLQTCWRARGIDLGKRNVADKAVLLSKMLLFFIKKNIIQGEKYILGLKERNHPVRLFTLYPCSRNEIHKI